jgi:hypothetical protein
MSDPPRKKFGHIKALLGELVPDPWQQAPAQNRAGTCEGTRAGETHQRDKPSIIYNDRQHTVTSVGKLLGKSSEPVERSKSAGAHLITSPERAGSSGCAARCASRGHRGE